MISKPCEECGATVTADDEGTFGAAFLAHARASHPDWAQYPDIAVTNFGEALLRLTGRRERLEQIGSVRIEHVTPDLLDDYLDFFDHDAFAGNPAWAACYCAEPHHVPRGMSSWEVPPVPWQTRRAQMTEFLTNGIVHAYLAYVDDRPAGWVNASTRAACSLYRHGTPDDAEIASVVCFVIAPPYRRHGLADALLTRVIADAPARGVAWIEAYPPTEPRGDDMGNFRGPPALFARHGFEAVGVDGPNTVMRRPVP